MATKDYPDPYLRKTQNGFYYYFTYTAPKTSKRKNKATGNARGKKEEARRFFRDFMDNLSKGVLEKTFRDYAEDYFLWDSCPHVKRLLSEKGKTIGKSHVDKSSRCLETHIFQDNQFCNLKMSEIKRHHIIDFRDRLIQKIGPCNTVNKVRDTLRTIFSEAYLREEIDRNPALKIGDADYEKKERDIFTTDEIKTMFEDCPGIWGDLHTFTVFYIAAFTGMRRNEILALMWDKVFDDKLIVHIHRAWKTRHGEMGLPKYNILCDIPVVEKIGYLTRELKEQNGEHELLFCYKDGGRFQDTWWKNNFNNALFKLGIFDKVRTAENYGKPTPEGWGKGNDVFTGF
jgi:integrase